MLRMVESFKADDNQCIIITNVIQFVLLKRNIPNFPISLNFQYDESQLQIMTKFI